MSLRSRIASSPLLVLVVTFFFYLGALVIDNPDYVLAQAGPPITSSGLNTQVTTQGGSGGGVTQHNITGGTRPGGGTNLFHSFGEFGVPDNHIANFQNDSGQPTNNILSRVTGGNSSNILGTIQTEGFGNANLFIMNPAGIVFGPNASLNVGGATHITTADYLKLADGMQFTALPSAQDTLLSVAPVAAFGFLNSTPNAISVENSTLSVNEGQAISLVGGDITIGSGLNAPGGRITLASVASQGEVLTDTFGTGPNINGQSFSEKGTIVLGEGATLSVSGDAAGSVVIRGGQLIMTNSTISADTFNSNGAQVGIDIHVDGEILVNNMFSPAFTARSFGSGNAGTIHTQSDKATFDATSAGFLTLIDTQAQATGNAGSVDINSGELTATAGVFDFILFIDSGTFGAGHGGDVNISAENFSLNNMSIATGTFLASLFGLDATGNGGDVTISTETLQSSFSAIVTDAASFLSATGQAGDIIISGSDLNLDFSIFTSIGFQGGDISINAEDLNAIGTSFETQTATFQGGGVTITGESLDFSQGTTIISTTNGDGHAGDINISATNRVGLLDQGGAGRPTGIFSNSFGFLGSLGNAGNIFITTPTLEMIDGARINSVTATSGSGGNVTINASQSISMSGEIEGLFPEPLFSLGSLQPSGIFTLTVGGSCAGTCGDAGNVTINTGSIAMEEGAQINSGTRSDGKGGNITLNATETISVSGALSDGSPAGVLSRTTSSDPNSGVGGNIALTAGESFFLGDGATVSASSSGPANAGNIQITGNESILMDNATVTTEAALASGGNIKLTAEELIHLVDSRIESSVQGDATTVGGDINLDPEFIILENSQILARAVAGQGGNITLIASEAVIFDNLSILDASSALGISGSINIEAPTQFISSVVQTLPQEPVDVATLYAARCVAGKGGHFSTFVDSKSDSLTPAPGTFLSSPLLPTMNPTAQTPSDSAPILLANYIPPGLFAEGAPSACP